MAKIPVELSLDETATMIVVCILDHPSLNTPAFEEYGEDDIDAIAPLFYTIECVLAKYVPFLKANKALRERVEEMLLEYGNLAFRGGGVADALEQLAFARVMVGATPGTLLN